MTLVDQRHSTAPERLGFLHTGIYVYKLSNATTTSTSSDCKSNIKQIEKKFSHQENDQSTSQVICTGTSTGDTERFDVRNLREEHYQLILSPTGCMDCDIIHYAHSLLSDIDSTMDGLQRTTLAEILEQLQDNLFKFYTQEINTGFV